MITFLVELKGVFTLIETETETNKNGLYKNVCWCSYCTLKSILSDNALQGIVIEMMLGGENSVQGPLF